MPTLLASSCREATRSRPVDHLEGIQTITSSGHLTRRQLLALSGDTAALGTASLPISHRARANHSTPAASLPTADLEATIAEPMGTLTVPGAIAVVGPPR